MLSGVILSIAMTAVSVPPGERSVDHTQPYKWGQPKVRYFHRRPVDDARRDAYANYVQDLDLAWQQYIDCGRTYEAFQALKANVRDRKASYVYQDPYYVPVTPRQWYEYRFRYPVPNGHFGNSVQFTPHHHGD